MKIETAAPKIPAVPKKKIGEIKSCRIHPGIGIARVGNSPEAFFIGPEIPGVAPPPDGGYKDAEGRVKRQAARFRIIAYDKDGKPLGELTSSQAKIDWSVELANKKAAYFEFYGRHSSRKNKTPRNAALADPEFKAGDSFDTKVAKLDRREGLTITPEARRISGPGVSGPDYRFDGAFLRKPVYLGELRTDPEGRLLMLGGRGESGAVNPKSGGGPIDKPLTHYANNDCWHDDVSDGPVAATVTLKGKARSMEAKNGAWVIVAPPNFAPGIESIVTLHDVMREAAIEHELLDAPSGIEYHRDIYPILKRALAMSWVNKDTMRGHGRGKRGGFNLLGAGSEAFTSNYKDRHPRDGDPNDPDDAVTLEKWRARREAILARIRMPLPLLERRIAKTRDRKEKTRLEDLRSEQASLAFMPPLSGDGGDASPGRPRSWLSVLPRQYEALESWVEGEFELGTAPSDAAKPSLAGQLEALQRAALEPCVGGAFYPGIEMTYIAEAREEDHHADLYCEAFRIRQDKGKYRPGDLTKHMAVPWQADFYECQRNWWPAQRPDDVVPQEVFEAISATMTESDQEPIAEGLESRLRWDRGLGHSNLTRRPWRSGFLGITDDPSRPGPNDDDPRSPVGVGQGDMVDYWHELGFVHEVTLTGREAGGRARGSGTTSEPVYIERERKPYAGMDLRKLFLALQNLDSHRDCLPKAKAYVDAVLGAARDLQQASGGFQFLDHIRPFDYTEDAFMARMNDIYDDAADWADLDGQFRFDPATHVLRTREDVIERIKQLTPFNFVDGAWLRKIHRIGTADEVNMLLFQILVEELGGGDVAKNHANIYRTLCQSVQFYPPPANSSAFAYSEDFLDAAFENPVFQLAISEFPETYYPELIGMTLFLEWSVQTLKRPAALLKHHGIDPFFYTLHVTIDNAEHGHGHKVVEAVKTYLSNCRSEKGEAAVQGAWRRIWDGYVAFGYTQTNLVEQIKYVVQHRPSIAERMVRMIQSKREYGQFNHGQKTLAGKSINSLLGYPMELLAALEQAELIRPGDATGSPLLGLFEFKGPMYNVFSPEEVALWREWIEWRDPRQHDIAKQVKGLGFSSRELTELVAWMIDCKPYRGPAETEEERKSEAAAFAEGLRKTAASTRRIRQWLASAKAELHDKGEVTKSLESWIHDRFLKPWLANCMMRVVNQLVAQDDGSLGYDRIVLIAGQGGTLRDMLADVRDSDDDNRPERRLLKALAESRFVVDGRPEHSPLVTGYLTKAGPMRRAFGVVVALNDGFTALETIKEWIRWGCPQPRPKTRKCRAAGLDVTEDEELDHPTGRAFGMPALH